jgi:outer membrane protein OmpA-like peptidoglycan-associated protein
VWPGRHGYGAPAARVFAALRHAVGPPPCPHGPEDRDGFEDGDGCADPDNDRDGVPDEADACPFDPEDRDGFGDGDGCPDWDDDADGLEDRADRCPRQSEDRDGFEDGDGCPEPDNDQDGIPDAADACALDPEDRDGFEDDDGCPEPGPRPVSISVGEQRILVSERIYFDDDRDTIRSVSAPVLDQLADVIRTLGPGVRVLVEGHTDDTGNAAYNVDLSHRRARAVVEYLAARGVPRARLDFNGYGASRPLAPNDSPEGRALNRRVEFLLLR